MCCSSIPHLLCHFLPFSSQIPLYKSHVSKAPCSYNINNLIFSKLQIISRQKKQVSMEKNNKRHEVWRALRDADFQEEDVWDVLEGYHGSSFIFSNHTTKPSFSTQTLLPSEPRMIPERQSRAEMAPMTQHSAPVNVPDHWSKVHRKKTKKVDDDDDDESVSPEEYFMRRSRSSSSSVMEGIGRKLKGRDLSKVRNAVLKKTGFLE